LNPPEDDLLATSGGLSQKNIDELELDEKLSVFFYILDLVTVT